ncbi:hypothetical protein [Rhizobium rhizogenes]|uniref:hypothetical protein n=1 Tax=Rhizobium rhizogenes TaxID=359 RepID=UPI001479171F|nr:hypothetical protein [Rhizobium rhizogenes]MDJ1638441.1 hypothetical protein [Rhizobium rhizogenes]NTG06192.1 hypothetical protein [Rhizobium rhizogenes]NTG33303.1 hypothetical protein [Rhizobium rhizogenes]NTG65862.1 hypothetical protein [Rhizobium rhizogenes]NTG98273.1 hypothetical protein [Rhizobium rhizogenes]
MTGMAYRFSFACFRHLELTLIITLGVKINVGNFAATIERDGRIISPGMKVAKSREQVPTGLCVATTYDKIFQCMTPPQNRKACASENAA